jgi:Fe-S cluster assembly protein SufD
MEMSLALKSYGLLLRNAAKKEGTFVYVPPNADVEIDVDGKGHMHMFLGQGARAKVTGKALSFVANLKRDSFLKMVFMAEEVDAKVELAEENSEVQLFGLAKLKGSEESHVNILIEHQAPNTRSQQLFKNVLFDEAKSSFEGKIYVHPIAQKTMAYQRNANLLLSDKAVAHAKPNLEIFADDVKASHGATIGQLDEEEMFYLRSRGLSREEAMSWLVEGFCKEILDA